MHHCATACTAANRCVACSPPPCPPSAPTPACFLAQQNAALLTCLLPEQGISASLIGILPYAAIRLGVYDGLKWSHRKYKQDDHIPALNTALYGAVAGLISATATFPVEVVR